MSASGIDQRTALGSYVSVADFPGVGASGFTVAFAMMPTRPGVAELGEQVVLSHANSSGEWNIGIDPDGRPFLTVRTQAGVSRVSAEEPLSAGLWVEVVARIPGRVGAALQLEVVPAGTLESNRFISDARAPARASGELSVELTDASGTLLWGCARLRDDRFPEGCFDGRLENPVVVADVHAAGPRADLAAQPATLAAWDLAADIGQGGVEHTKRVTDRGSHGLHGVAHQHPHRLVTSSRWDGIVHDGRFAPQQYAAIHFHRSDMTDCGWRSQAEITLPSDLPSGVYAARISDAAGTEDLVPIFVTPREEATAPLLLVLPTNSYLAYANDHVGIDSPRTQVWTQMVPTLDDFELFRNARRELGLSLYEVHGDGSPVFYSSWRRPILTMRERAYDHNAPVWQFTGDMQLVDWLDRTGRPFDIATDREVHERGPELLSQYAAVMTGTHPEYATGEMLDAYETYVSTGGRLLYMGGNGMYWVTGYDPDDEQVIEIRRWGGTQAWTAAPGEYHLSFSGELGGTWRFRGRPPQKSFGVGFVAAGNPGASGAYRRASGDARVEWVFAGVQTDDDEFGHDGVSGGAAGLEIDAVDALLGTSPDAIVLATSVGHSDDMLEARENFNMTSRILGGARNPRVRSDLVLVPRTGGGAVFSTGSIAFAGALYADKRGSGVGRLLANVLDRFLSGEPILDEVGRGPL